MESCHWLRSVTAAFIISLLTLTAHAVSAEDRLSIEPVLSSRAQQSLLLDITRSDSRLVAVGDQGTVLLSDDEGGSWKQVTVPVSVMLTGVTFSTPQNSWIVGHDGLLARSQDAGQSWQRVMDGTRINQLRLASSQQNYARLEQRVAAQPDNDALLEQLDELSYSLEDAEIAVEEGPTTPLLDIWFRDSQLGFALGGYGLLLKTSDGGDSWQYWGDRLPNPDGFHLNSMTEDHLGRIYIAGEAGLLLRSDDGGDSWVALDVPYDGSFFALTEYRNQLYLTGLRGNLFVSSDGESWHSQDTGYSTTFNGAVSSADELLLIGHGGRLLSSAKGDLFEVIESGGRRSFSAGIDVADGWLLVGEGGVQKVVVKQGDDNG
ncbi:WD40/YVTN/BNR-like repeat-containing protein [Amphritea sp. HPY]|uniref:WD40/YVTN/BNR-like repeat-containing protein n=1 Tax=Amphritea sp. HPY TaxID=3421652 RepID=UPI003D7CB7E4